MRPRRVLPLALLVLAAPVGVALGQAAPSPGAVARGWAPLVALLGGGDARATRHQLQEALGLARCVLEGLEVDEPTREFFLALRGSLDEFDLEEFHEALPDEDGAWRRMRLVGRRDGAAYRLGKAPQGAPRAIDPSGPLGPRPGDLVATLSARPVPTDERTNYVMRVEAGVGAGPLGWSRLRGFLTESLRLCASGDLRSPSAAEPARRARAETLREVTALHPKLRPEDVEVVAVLHEAFPRLAEVLLEVARIEDVLVLDPAGASGYQQLRLIGRLCPELMEERYPELAEFLAELGPLLRSDGRIQDGRGRTLARVAFDSSRLVLGVEAFVRDGVVLPVQDGRVVLGDEAPAGGATSPSPAEREFSLEGDVTSDLNGVVTTLRGLRLDGTLVEGADGATLAGAITRTPRVRTSGEAFGILPTWAIDVVIPGNLEELVTEFLTAMSRGADGRGLTASLQVRQAGPDDHRGASPATIAGALELEVLNSLLVQIGAKVAGQKLLPGADAREELWELMRRGRSALEGDLDAFTAGASR